MTDNIQIGQTFYLFNIDRRDKEEDREVTVLRIGKKYIYVKGRYEEIKFEKDTLQHVNPPFSPKYTLFNSKQECEYQIETERRRQEISNRLYYFLTMEEVNELYNLLILRDK